MVETDMSDNQVVREELCRLKHDLITLVDPDAVSARLQRFLVSFIGESKVCQITRGYHIT